MPLVQAQEHLGKIEELAKAGPRQLAGKILANSSCVEALAVVAEEDSAKFEELCQQLRDKGVFVKDIDAIKKGLSSKRREHRGLRLAVPGETPSLVKVMDVLPHAPVNDDLLVPAGWVVDLATGVTKFVWDRNAPGESQPLPVAPSPIIIVGRLKQVGSGAEALRLAWYRDGRWQSQTVDRKSLASKKEIVELADYGVPVTSLNAGLLIEFLAAFEAQNLSSLPLATVTDHLGWVDGKQGFLWGATHIRGDGSAGEAMDLEEISPEIGSRAILPFGVMILVTSRLPRAFAPVGPMKAGLPPSTGFFLILWSWPDCIFHWRRPCWTSWGLKISPWIGPTAPLPVKPRCCGWRGRSGAILMGGLWLP